MLSYDAEKEVAQFQVVKTIRGTHKPGDKISAARMRSIDGGDVNKEILYLNVHYMGPEFPVLTLDYEDEVRFLASLEIEDKDADAADRLTAEQAEKDPEAPRPKQRQRDSRDPKSQIKDLAEAIKRIQGISVESTRGGKAYVLEHSDGAVAALIHAADALRPELLKTEEPYFPSYRMRNLMEALASLKDPAVDAWFEDFLTNFLKSNSTPIDYKKAASPNGEALMLDAALEVIAKRAELVAKLKDILVTGAPKQDGLHCAETIYGLGKSGVLKDEDILKLADKIENKDAVALGCFWIAEEDDWWQWKAAKIWVVHANVLAVDSDLKAKITKLTKRLHRDD